MPLGLESHAQPRGVDRHRLPFYVLLNRPPDRLPDTGVGVGVGVAGSNGQPMGTQMETALPAGLTRGAFLAVVLDETCLPA